MKKADVWQYIKSFFYSFINLWNSREVLRPANIRIGHLQYFFALPLALTFVNIQGILLAGSYCLFGLSSNALTFISFSIGAALMFIIRSAHNIHIVSKISSVLTLAGFIPWLFLPKDGFPAFTCAAIFMAGVGCCMASSSTFMMALNNAERFFGCVLMTFIISFARVNSNLIQQQVYLRLSIITFLVIGISICMFRTKKEDFSDSNKGKYREFHPSIWLSLFFLVSFFSIRFMWFGVQEFNIQLSTPLKNILAITPAMFCVIVHLIFNRSVWIMCNVFFISSLLSYVMSFAQNQFAAYIFSGINEIGLLVGFYLCACVVNRFCDFRRHKIMEFVCISILGTVYIFTDLLKLIKPPAMPVRLEKAMPCKER